MNHGPPLSITDLFFFISHWRSTIFSWRGILQIRNNTTITTPRQAHPKKILSSQTISPSNPTFFKEYHQRAYSTSSSNHTQDSTTSRYPWRNNHNNFQSIEILPLESNPPSWNSTLGFQNKVPQLEPNSYQHPSNHEFHIPESINNLNFHIQNLNSRSLDTKTSFPYFSITRRVASITFKTHKSIPTNQLTWSSVTPD